jgi:hypothetical protein
VTIPQARCCSARRARKWPRWAGQQGAPGADQMGRDLGKTVEVVSGLSPGPGSSTIPRFHRARSGRACRRGASWLRHGGARSPEQRAFSPWPRDWRGARSPRLRRPRWPCAQIRRHGAVGSGHPTQGMPSETGGRCLATRSSMGWNSGSDRQPLAGRRARPARPGPRDAARGARGPVPAVGLGATLTANRQSDQRPLRSNGSLQPDYYGAQTVGATAATRPTSGAGCGPMSRRARRCPGRCR